MKEKDYNESCCVTQAVTPLTLTEVLEQRREHYLKLVASIGDAIKLLKNDKTLEEQFRILHNAVNL